MPESKIAKAVRIARGADLTPEMVHDAYKAVAVGTEEGDICRRDGCCGRIELEKVQCLCGLVPAPCSACENAGLECTECGWSSHDD